MEVEAEIMEVETMVVVAGTTEAGKKGVTMVAEAMVVAKEKVGTTEVEAIEGSPVEYLHPYLFLLGSPFLSWIS